MKVSEGHFCSMLFVFVILSLFLLLIAQAKAKSQSGKVNINSALVQDIINLEEVKADMIAVVNSLKDDFTRSLNIRTSPGIYPYPCPRCVSEKQ